MEWVGNFNYLIAPGTYTQIHVWIFSIHILYHTFTILSSHNSYSQFCTRSINILAVLFSHKTHTQFCIRTINAYTVLSLDKQRAYVASVKVFEIYIVSKSEDHLFVQPVHLRSTKAIITQRTRYLGTRYFNQRCASMGYCR